LSFLSFAASAGFDTSGAEYKLRIQELDVQKSLVEASYNAQIITQKNTDALGLLSAALQEQVATAMKEKPGAKPEEKVLAETMLKQAEGAILKLTAKSLLQEGTSVSSIRSTLGEREDGVPSEKIKNWKSIRPI
jgi:hypothetical protein